MAWCQRQNTQVLWQGTLIPAEMVDKRDKARNDNFMSKDTVYKRYSFVYIYPIIEW